MSKSSQLTFYYYVNITAEKMVINSIFKIYYFIYFYIFFPILFLFFPYLFAALVNIIFFWNEVHPASWVQLGSCLIEK